MSRHALGFTLALLWIVTSCASAEKYPVPEDGPQQEASSLIANLFKEEYEAAKSIDERIALAGKLFDLGKETNDDPTSRFVLFRISKDIAIKAGDFNLGLETVKRMDQDFKVDGIALKAEVLAKAAMVVKSSDQHRELADLAKKFVDEAILEDRFDVAGGLHATALASARRARARDLTKELTTLGDEIETRQSKYEKVAAAITQLEQAPTDPLANERVGKYRCFVKKEWQQGIPNLALGSEPSLCKVAALELAARPESMKVGDGWWEVAEALPEYEEQARSRGGFWYRRALSSLTGLAKARVEKRLEVAPPFEEVAPPTQSPQPGIISGNSSDAVATKGYAWLLKTQEANGSWSFQAEPNPGSLRQGTEAATAMALIALLRSGKTTFNNEYRDAVGRGATYIFSRVQSGKSGVTWPQTYTKMYGHALCTMALGEVCLRTRDRNIRTYANGATVFIINSQDTKGGGWRYVPRQAGDTSVLGWQLQALKTMERARVSLVPSLTYSRANAFLDSVQTNNGTGYGYTSPSRNDTTTAIGLWARTQLGWSRSDPRITAGAKYFIDRGPARDNYYQNYFVSLLLRELGDTGVLWAKQLRQQITSTQGTSGDIEGSWYRVGGDGHGPPVGGRHYCTCMTLMTLQNLDKIEAATRRIRIVPVPVTSPYSRGTTIITRPGGTYSRESPPIRTQ